jgi:CMP-2-keto-3-deoxyoctulosonic acid synthetase
MKKQAQYRTRNEMLKANASLKRPKLNAEELEQLRAANRGAGLHRTSKRDSGKRKANPFKQLED